MERGWYIVNHWEDQFCRDVYQNLCVFAEFQHPRATALISPGTTPLVCPVDSLINTHPAPPLGTQVTMKTLGPCAWRYVLVQDDLASFRLKARSDVVGAWEIESTTHNYFYCQVKIVVSAHCFISTNSKTGKNHFSQQMEKEDSVATRHTRVLLLPPALTRLIQPAIILLKRDNAPPTGASRAHHESQTRIFKTEAPLFVGLGEGTDNLDFLADLSALKVIDPDEVWGQACAKERFTSSSDVEVRGSPTCTLCMVHRNS